MEKNNYNNFARSIWDLDPSISNSNKINPSNQSIADPLVANYLKSQMIARGNSLNRSSVFNFDGFLEKVEDEKKKLIELVMNNFEKKMKETKLEKIQVINFEKEEDEDDPCYIYLCPICSSFKSVYPVQCLKCEKIYCVECSKNMIAKESGCSCGLKPFEEKEIGRTTKQTIDKFKVKCPNLLNQCSKIMNFERINFHFSQDCLNIEYKYVCKHCNTYIETSFWKMELLRDHLMHCDEISVKCEFCEKEVLRKNINEHYNECDFRRVKCEDCEREMVFGDYKAKHSKAACFEIIRNKFILEMQVIKEENYSLRNENDIIKKELEIGKLEIQNYICQRQIFNNKIEELSKNLVAKEDKIEMIKIECDKIISDLNLKLNEETEKNLNNLNKIYNLKYDYELKLNDLKTQQEIEKYDEANNILNLMIKLLDLSNNKKEILYIDIPNRTIYYKNGLKYIGEIKDNQENGEGTLYSLRFYKVYQGQFINGKKSGRGIQFNQNFIHNGFFENDKRNGEGVFFRIGEADKFEKYTGNWKDDKKSGYGKQYDDQKLIYQGNFLEDKYNGMGILYHDNGYYKGELSENKKNGKGVFYFTEGSHKDLRYEGTWKDDVKYGEFKIIDKDEKIIKEGIYEKK